MKRAKGYDSECLDLANYFLTSTVCADGDREELAQEIQDTVESWFRNWERTNLPPFPAQDDAPLGAAENHGPGSGGPAAAPPILSREEFLTKRLAERGSELETLKQREQELEDVLTRVTRDLVHLLDKDGVSRGEERALLQAALNGLRASSESDEQWNAQCGVICQQIESYLSSQPAA